MRGPSVERLRRLRWRLTAIFTVMNTLGLLLLAPLVIILDANRSDEGVNNKLEVVSQSVIRLITDNVSLGLERIAQDPLYNECPAFMVLPGGAPSFPVQQSGDPCTPVDRAVLDQVATDAVSSGNIVRMDRKAVSGGGGRIIAVPFKDSSNRFSGAVVSWADTACWSGPDWPQGSNSCRCSWCGWTSWWRASSKTPLLVRRGCPW